VRKARPLTGEQTEVRASCSSRALLQQLADRDVRNPVFHSAERSRVKSGGTQHLCRVYPHFLQQGRNYDQRTNSLGGWFS
jgi:hypothetical protein